MPWDEINSAGVRYLLAREDLKAKGERSSLHHADMKSATHSAPSKLSFQVSGLPPSLPLMSPSGLPAAG
jgi:hypothetical protein